MIVRAAEAGDVPAMLEVQNAIIRRGGTTAHETEMTAERFIRIYMDAPLAICCFVAEDAGGIIGFQALGIHDGLPDGWAEIGTFVSPDRQRTGAGQALFAATVEVAKARGFAAIDATIRADNVVGLGYYALLGFVDYAADPEYCLSDGTRVGRISKRFDL